MQTLNLSSYNLKVVSNYFQFINTRKFRFILIPSGNVAVSYTHLDVYKRQTLNFKIYVAVLPRLGTCLLYTSTCRRLFSASSASCRRRSSVSVSYTHLDVYKRQR